MKRNFSAHWKASKQPRKQRKYCINAPQHIKHKFLSANLNKELRKKYKRRSFSLIKGDSVVIMRGEFKKKSGKIGVVDTRRMRVSIEGIQKDKRDGTKVNVWFSPSKLQVKELKLEDKKRIEALQRTTKNLKTEEKENVSKKK